jgi:hypothetical protein
MMGWKPKFEHPIMPPLPDDVLYSVLDAWPVAVLSTYGRQSIDSVPVVFVRDGGTLYSPIDGKPKSGRTLARVSNLRRDDRYTLLLQNYQQDWQSLWWLKLSGSGRVLESVDQKSVDQKSVDQTPSLVPVLVALAGKYPQYRTTHVLGDQQQLLALRIDSMNAWAYQGLDWLDEQFS